MTNAIEIKNVSKVFRIPHEKRRSFLKEFSINLLKKTSYEEFFALKNVSITIKKGEFVGLIGKNGSGKSTLLKTIAGIYQADSGSIKINGKVSSFLELGVGFNPELTVKENIFLYGAILGLSREEIRKRFAEIISFAELERFVDAKLKTLSSGMQVRAGFATAIQADADIYLVDEVLAVGDRTFQQKCFDVFEKFKKKGKTIVFVSHDLTTIERFCTRILLLEEGSPRFIGNAGEAVTIYLKEDNSKNQGLSIWGNKTGEIIAVEFLDGKYRKRKIFETEEKFTIRIHFRFNQKVANPTFGVAIYKNNILLLAPNTTDSKFETGKLNSKGFVDFTVDPLPFLGGHYEVAITLYDSKKVTPYDHHDRIYSFDVRTKNTVQLGFLELNGKWKLTKN